MAIYNLVIAIFPIRENTISRGGTMQNACLFEIMAMPEATLKRALPNVSTRMLARLITAYPRAAGRPLMDILVQCMSQPTIEFIREEVNAGIVPTMPEIR